LRVLMLERGELVRAPCCDTCSADLNVDRRAELVRASRAAAELVRARPPPPR
jgi:hypothetical protein